MQYEGFRAKVMQSVRATLIQWLDCNCREKPLVISSMVLCALVAAVS